MIAPRPCPQTYSNRDRRRDILKLYLLVFSKHTKWPRLKVDTMQARHLLQCLPPILDEYLVFPSKLSSIQALHQYTRSRCHLK